MTFELRPYQKEGVDFLLASDRALLADQQGLGKTVIACAALQQKQPKSVLVICPGSSRIIWVDHLCEFGFGGRVVYPNANNCKRANKKLQRGWEAIPLVDLPKDAEETGGVFVISYTQAITPEATAWLQGNNFQVVIVDEAHKLKESGGEKTYASQWEARKSGSQIHKKIRRFLFKKPKNCETVWALTGTPVVKETKDLPNILLGTNIIKSQTEFYEHLDLAVTAAFPNSKSDEDEVVEEMDDYRRILWQRGIMLRRTKKEVLPQLREKEYQDIWLQTNQDAVEETIAREYGDKDERDWAKYAGAVVERERALVGAQKAGQFDKVLDKVLDYLRSGELGNPGPLLFWAHHKEVLCKIEDSINRRLPDLETIRLDGDTPPQEREGLIKQFQESENPRAFVCSIRAISEAVTMTKSRVAIFFQRDWSPAINEQAEDRIHRFTQGKQVLIVRVWSHNSPVDERVMKRLKRRSEGAKLVMDDLRTQRSDELRDIIRRRRETTPYISI